MRVPFAPHPHQYLVLSAFSILAILMGVSYCGFNLHFPQGRFFLCIWPFVCIFLVMYLFTFLLGQVEKILCSRCKCFLQIHVLHSFSFTIRSSLKAQLVKNPPAMQETPVQFLGWEDLLEKG